MYALQTHFYSEHTCMFIGHVLQSALISNITKALKAFGFFLSFFLSFFCSEKRPCKKKKITISTIYTRKFIRRKVSGTTK